MNQPDNKFLSEALKIAADNIPAGGGPFGAVVVRDGEIIARAANRVVANHDPTAHAEVLAIREAAKKSGNFDLSDCVIYTSCEPCPMCLGAIYWAGIKKVVFASDRKDAARAGFSDDKIYSELSYEREEREITFIRGLKEEGAKVLKQWDEYERKVRY